MGERLEMNNSNVIGAILGMERTELSLTIAKVCNGLCSASTYNRYEGGKMLPDKFMLSALLERMGKNPNRIVYTVTDEEHKLLDIRKKIIDSLSDEDEKRVRKYLCEYRRISKVRCKNIHKQFELEVEGELCLLSNDTGSALNYFKYAFEQTNKKKSYEDIKSSIYTVREFDLLYKIGMLSDFELLYKLCFFLKKLNDNHYLKVSFYGDLIADLVTRSEGKWMRLMQLELIEAGVQYKRRIKQSNGITRLLELKKKCVGELSSHEEILVNMDKLLT